jgi:hypothetical protein
MPKFKYACKVIRSDDHGTTTIAEGDGEREAESWEALRASFTAEMKLVFPQEPYADVDYYIWPKPDVASATTGAMGARDALLALGREAEATTRIQNHVRARFNGATCQADPLTECTYPRCSCADMHDDRPPGRLGQVVASLTIGILLVLVVYLYGAGYFR